MISKKNRKNQLLRLPILYVLFLFVVLGAVVGIVASKACNMEAFVTVGQGSLRSVIVSNAVYLIGVVLLSRIWFGFAAIPIVLFYKGFSISAAVCVMLQIAEVDVMTIILRIGIPSALQMIGLLYISPIFILVSIKRLKGCSMSTDDLTGMKRGVRNAGLWSVLSVISACVIY